MTLNAILADCYRRLRHLSSPPSAITTRLTAFANETIRDVLTIPGLDRLRDDTIPITALANTARSGLPVAVARIQGITDRTNNKKLTQCPLSDLRIDDPSRSSVGSHPYRYAVVSNQAVQVQPTQAGSALYAVSTSAADITSIKAYTESIISGGYPQNFVSAGTILTGATRVQIGTRTDHMNVTRFYLDGAAAGFVSLYDASSGGNELARLPLGQTFSRYLAVEWWPIQDANVTNYADVTYHVFDLVNGTDEPLLPNDHHELVVMGTLMREYQVLSDSRYAMAFTEYERAKDRLKAWVMDDGDRIVSLRPVRYGFNRLGPTFPAEPWPG